MCNTQSFKCKTDLKRKKGKFSSARNWGKGKPVGCRLEQRLLGGEEKKGAILAP